MPTPAPTLRTERELLRALPHGSLLAGVDEVGRGALAGPVSVGIVVVDAATRTAPAGVRDSKLLTAAARRDLEPRLRRWAVARAVGHASPHEIDAIGIVAALRLAATRALDTVAADGVVPDLLLLDGSHDWFTDPSREGLFAELGDGPAPPPVVTRVKADMRCASVAAASVLAKVERDALVADLARTDAALAPYGLDVNKGYASPTHLAALRAHGPSAHHRRSWRLPERDPAPGGAPGGVGVVATGAVPPGPADTAVTGGDAARTPALGHNGRAPDDTKDDE